MKDSLEFKRRNTWLERERGDIERVSEEYMRFIDGNRTVRRTVEYFIEEAKNFGFTEWNENKKSGKFYVVNKGKSVGFFVMDGDLNEGFNIIVAHIDSPRIDLKPMPLIEDEGFLIAKTRYYGGIKKYQWFSIPLALEGVVYTSDGRIVELSVGFKEEDPVLVIPDLLPHLDKEDMKLSEKFKGESLNPILGTIPAEKSDEKAKNKVKMRILKILKEKYGIVEEDLISAELELVPALEVREVGFDSSLIAAYGHDDRVCAYSAFKALIESKERSRNSIVLLLDREEIGSEGNTGARSRFWYRILRRIVGDNLDELLEKSAVISGDVSAGLNPLFKDVHELNNAPRLGHGVIILRYTGRNGKFGASEARAEFVGKLRILLNENGVIWQAGELGKVDVGGGGTVAKFFAELGMDVVDMGPPVLSMHSPYELLSKADLHETIQAYRVFLEKFS